MSARRMDRPYYGDHNEHRSAAPRKRRVWPWERLLCTLGVMECGRYRRWREGGRI